MSTGIAIVGMACRYPDAKTPAELWENVLAGRRAFRRIPAERLRLEDYLSEDRADPDGLYATEAAVLEGYEFDRVRFRVAGRTFRSADLAHWLALDVAAQALGDAGFPDGDGLPRESTGVLLGNSLTGEFSRANLLRLRWPYVRRVLAAALAREGRSGDDAERLLAEIEAEYKAPFPETTEESLAGGLSNTIAGRICNHFDFHGGGYTLDGACASSLLAVANGCSALAAGDLDVALAGGVDLSLDPFELVGFARTGALAPGEMRVFDARSAGFVPGEGCGFVVLMREGDAAARGCRVYAVVRGWGISSDGAGGISRPESEGQKLALRRAYRRSGFGIDSVGYFEGHGTGTAVGDAAELKALSEARREAGAADRTAVGSIKANIGHTKAAAGVAGLLKATLALRHQILPPNTGCDEPHAELTGASATLRVLSRGLPWPSGVPLRAGVSAMGFGGINTHLVVEAAEASRRGALTPRERELLASAQDAELLLFSAGDAASLDAEVERIEKLALRLSRGELADLAAYLNRRLAPGAARAAVVAATPRELVERLGRVRELLAGGASSLIEARQGVFLGIGVQPRRIGFLFPGQGSPSYAGGGTLRRRFEGIDAVYRLADELTHGDPIDTAVAQPSIVSNSLAALSLLEQLGIRAAVAVGHSLGEIAALAWAGALDVPAAIRLAAERGRAMASVEGEKGTMASIKATPAAVEALLDGLEAVIASLNAPERTVVSGREAAVATVTERAHALGYEATRLKVSHAFHSPLVAQAAPRLRRELGKLAWRPLARQVASTVTGGLLAPDADLTELLTVQVTSPVRFTAALAAARDLADLWIEVGPGRALSGLARESFDLPAVAVDAGGGSLGGLLRAAGAAFALGSPLDPGVLFDGRYTKPFDPDRPLKFLANPCESAAVDATATGSAVVRRPAPPARKAQAAERTGKEAGGSVKDVLRRLVAERAELPVESVHDDTRLLSDLHLNSISVGQLMVDTARRMGLKPPASPTDFAHATVAEVAQALAAQAPAAGPATEEPALPAGVDSWVRAFTVELVPAEAAKPKAGGIPGNWRIVAPPGHPLAPALASRLAGRGVALCLPAGAGAASIPLLLAAAKAVVEDNASHFAVVQQGGGGGGFARTLHLEMPKVTTTVVDLPFGHPEAAAWVAAEAAGASGYTEAHYDATGHRRVPVLSLFDAAPATPADAVPLGPGDVLLVSGGGKGIAAECALSLARDTGARLALLGRSQPDADAELAANLARVEAAGVTFLYVRADVCDAGAVAAAVEQVKRTLGPVTALLHSAGTNTPRLLSQLDEAAFERTAAPKVQGLDNLLAALDSDWLRLLVTFGSIIGRIGLVGEGDYAAANEWLTRATERYGQENPGCRCLALEWSVWGGVGMGAKLGTLESLIRQGITPIPPDLGVEWLKRLLRVGPGGPRSVVVAGRFGVPPTLGLARRELPLLRYLEKPRVHYPGLELVVDSDVSFDTDPHLADHIYRGEPLFAAVLGLEAMAQAAAAVVGTDEAPAFENVSFDRPVAVPRGGSTTLRVAALVREPGRVDVVLRDASTGFAADHFRATCRFGGVVDRTPRLLVALPQATRRVALDPAADLYGGVLFHQGRFRRVAGYRTLTAKQSLADVSPDGEVPWFGRYLPDRLLLGDPGARDAAIHGVQASIPHSTLLPTGVERLTTLGISPEASLMVASRERSRNGNDFVYDLEILGTDGTLYERWEGLKLRAVDRIAAPSTWTVPLLATYLERRLEEFAPAAGVRVAIEWDANGRPDGKRVIAHLAEGTVRHRPDGKPEAGGSQVSVSHAGGLTFAVTSGGTALGCDIEPVAARSQEDWRDLLGAERFALVGLIAGAEQGEDAAATRVWAAAESLKKAGVPLGAPLVLDTTAEDGWLLLRSGELTIGTLVAPVRELGADAAIAVLFEKSPGA